MTWDQMENNMATSTAKKLLSTSTPLDLYRVKLWETEHKVLEHHHPKIKAKMRSFTVCYKLPVNTFCLESLVINGVLVYDFAGEPRRTSVIGGGGRFELRRRFYDGVCVGCELLLKDVCYYSTKKPVVKCVLGVL